MKTLTPAATLARLIHCVAVITISTQLTGCKKEEDQKPQIVDITCIPEDLHENVLAFYPITHGSYYDFSGKARFPLHKFGDGVVAAEDRFGNVNCAARMNSESGLSGYDVFLDDVEKFSVSFWYKPEDPSRDPSKFEGLISRGLGSFHCDGYGAWSIALFDCRKAVFAASSSLWDEQITLSCETEVTARTNVWHHLVATYDGTTKEMKLYSEAILQGTTTQDDECRDPLEKDQGLAIGVQYTGVIDDIIFFNKVLTDDEVRALNGMNSCWIE